MNAPMTRKIRELEKSGTQARLDEFLRQCAEKQVDLSPWAKRLAALRKKILLKEVHES